MIPKIIHYCWFGRGPMPQLALDCIASWHKYMPDWEYKLWNEDNFDINCNQYVKEAYEARKFAFVSDYARLKALYEEGGLYFDTDVMVLKPFNELMEHNTAFCGFEGSKTLPIGTCVMASVPKGKWIEQMLLSYNGRTFISDNGSYDITTNTSSLSKLMEQNGFMRNGVQQQYKDLTIFPVYYFSPRQTTGEFFLTENTYSNHLGVGSWTDGKNKFSKLARIIGQKNMTRLIKLKRKIIG